MNIDDIELDEEEHGIKTCKKCGEGKTHSDFYKDSRGKDGLRAQCKACASAQRKANYLKNKDKVATNCRIYREKNKEIRVVWGKIYREKNKEAIKSRGKAYYAKNKEVMAAYQMHWRKKNKEYISARGKKYYVNNKALYNAQAAKRRAVKLQATPKWVETEEIKDVYLEAQHCQMHVDHIIPLQHPLVCGLHCWENLQLLSAEENLKKSNTFEV